MKGRRTRSQKRVEAGVPSTDHRDVLWKSLSPRFDIVVQVLEKLIVGTEDSSRRAPLAGKPSVENPEGCLLVILRTADMLRGQIQSVCNDPPPKTLKQMEVRWQLARAAQKGDAPMLSLHKIAHRSLAHGGVVHSHIVHRRAVSVGVNHDELDLRGLEQLDPLRDVARRAGTCVDEDQTIRKPSLKNLFTCRTSRIVRWRVEQQTITTTHQRRLNTTEHLGNKVVQNRISKWNP